MSCPVGAHEKERGVPTTKDGLRVRLGRPGQELLSGGSCREGRFGQRNELAGDRRIVSVVIRAAQKNGGSAGEDPSCDGLPALSGRGGGNPEAVGGIISPPVRRQLERVHGTRLLFEGVREPAVNHRERIHVSGSTEIDLLLGEGRSAGIDEGNDERIQGIVDGGGRVVDAVGGDAEGWLLSYGGRAAPRASEGLRNAQRCRRCAFVVANADPNRRVALRDHVSVESNLDLDRRRCSSEDRAKRKQSQQQQRTSVMV